MELNGRVIEEQKNYFLVDTPNGVIRCVIKGSLKKVRTRVCVGDLVLVTVTNSDKTDTDHAEGIIAKVESRTSFIKRPAIANLTRILLIATWKSPPLDFEALDRMLFSAEVFGIEPVIVFNKIDLLSADELLLQKEIMTIYERCGYTTLATSAQTGDNIDKLLDCCKDGISAFTGLSGVGKSTLLSKIFPDTEFRIGDVSGTYGRGTHTTTNNVLHPFTPGSYLADTPGLSFVDIPTVPEESVASCFPEIAACTGLCRFNNCTHDGAPGCAVQEKIDNNEISESRRSQYLKIYNEMKSLRKQYSKKPSGSKKQEAEGRSYNWKQHLGSD